jgi:hypothetical protein
MEDAGQASGGTQTDATDPIQLVMNVTDVVSELSDVGKNILTTDTADIGTKHYLMGVDTHGIVVNVVLAVLFTIALYLLYRIYKYISSELTVEKSAKAHTKDALNRAEYFSNIARPYFKVIAVLGCTTCLVIVGVSVMAFVTSSTSAFTSSPVAGLVRTHVVGGRPELLYPPTALSTGPFAVAGLKSGTDKVTHHGYQRFYPR